MSRGRRRASGRLDALRGGLAEFFYEAAITAALVAVAGLVAWLSLLVV